jgi:hypothetical protein
VVGVSFSLLEQTATEILLPDIHWLSSLREFLTSIDASIHIDGLSLPEPLRENDVCIMDVIHSLPGLTKAQLRAFNRCRIFFGVQYVSELTSADGCQLCRDAWEWFPTPLVTPPVAVPTGTRTKILSDLAPVVSDHIP